jgi:hypothetical protein
MHSKLAVLLCTLLYWNSLAFGQSSPAPPPPGVQDLQLKAASLERTGKRNRTAGTALVAIGATLVVLSLVGTVVDFGIKKLDWTEVGVGFAFGLAGTGMTVGGIPLLITGSVDLERARSLRSDLR